MVKPRTEQEWAAIIEEYQRSGQTQRAFCQRQKIGLSTLGHQLRRYRKLIAHPSPGPEGESRLVELQLPPVPVPGSGPKSAAVPVCIEWNAVRIRCQCHQVGEVLAQIQALVPERP